jgi:hypothetical protein
MRNKRLKTESAVSRNQQLGKWTRSERIRTVARVPLVMTTREFAERPVYHQIAAKALHLSQLGLPLSRIAETLGVTPKTAAKAVRFLKCST